MRIEIIGEVKDNPDGSGTVDLELDEEGKMYLIQLGFETLLKRGLGLCDQKCVK